MKNIQKQTNLRSESIFHKNLIIIGITIINKIIKQIPMMHNFFLFAALWLSAPCQIKVPASFTFSLALSTLSSISSISFCCQFTNLPTYFCTFNAYYILFFTYSSYFYFNYIICSWNRVYWFTSSSWICAFLCDYYDDY